MSHETKASDRKALLHLALRILTLPPIVIGVTLLLMYAPAGLLTRRELLLCEVFLLVIPLAAYPLREIFHIGKDRRRGQRGTGMAKSGCSFHVNRNAGAVVLQACPLARRPKPTLSSNSAAIEMT